MINCDVVVDWAVEAHLRRAISARLMQAILRTRNELRGRCRKRLRPVSRFALHGAVKNAPREANRMSKPVLVALIAALAVPCYVAPVSASDYWDWNVGSGSPTTRAKKARVRHA